MPLAPLFTPPYYAVIFTSLQTGQLDGYAETARRMEELAQQQPGFLGIDSARQDLGITVSYWRSLEDIRAWRENSEHSLARESGRRRWYSQFTLRIAKVEHNYDFHLP
jgi:heme-degrading monooxygenase HmoA